MFAVNSSCSFLRLVSRSLLICLFLSAGASFARAHTFHTSLTRLEFNPQTRSLEITTQLYAHDLEIALTKRNGDKTVDLERTPDADKMILAYLQKVFVLQNRRGETIAFSWVGKELKGDMLWLYYEAPLSEGLTGARLRDSIFFELAEDQINRVNVVTPELQATIDFKSGDDFRVVGAQKTTTKR